MRARISTALVLAVVVGACGDPEPDRPADAPVPAQPATGAQVPAVQFPAGVTHEMAVEGQQLFSGQGGCFACHGGDATGTALGPNLRDQEWLNTDGSFEQIIQVIQAGVAQPVRYPGTMPPLGGARLNEDQVRQLGAYVYAISRGG
jgi:mono/diheme cytochrome c family protein